MIEELLSISQKILYFVDNELKPKIVETETGLKDVTLALFAKSTKTFRAICNLCCRGFGEDATILARALLESVINLTYIQKEDSQHRTELFIFYSFIDRRRKAEQFKNDSVIGEYIKGIDKKFDGRFKEEHDKAVKLYSDERVKINSLRKYKAKKYGWSCLSIKDMATETDLKELYYDKVYWLISQISHPDVNSLGNYFYKGKDSSLNIVDVPNKQWVVEAIVLGFDCYSKMVRLINEIFKLGLITQIEKIEKKYAEIVRKKS